MRHRFLLPLLPIFLVLACNQQEDPLAARSRRVFGTLPAKIQNADSVALVKLGEQLYFSTELSANRTQSCNSCHPVDAGGADGRPTSRGALGPAGRRNAPTVLNASMHVSQFWDGRASTLEEQAAGPIVNPVEMAMPSEAAVAERLRAFDFSRAFPNDPDPHTIANAARAIAAFERTLVTRDRFDDFQNGRSSALTAREKEGLQLFMKYGCTSCHNGPLLGGNRMMKLGIVNDYDNLSDRGLAEVTKKDGDAYVFKIPALRNVGATAPYFHDGRIGTLEEAVERMAWHQLGMKIAASERDAIAAFLRSLDGSLLR
jgi:cytochrome c peroxidase